VSNDLPGLLPSQTSTGSQSDQPAAQATGPKSAKKRKVNSAPPDYPWGIKTWLKRKEILWEYGLCARTVRRLEQRGLLSASKIVRHCIYKRSDVETCLEQGKWSASADDRVTGAKGRRRKF